MKIKTSELEGVSLDWAVADAIDEIPYIDRGRLLCMRGGTLNNRCDYSTDWNQGGPLIERYGVWLSDDNETAEPWIGSIAGLYMQYGPTPLIAACRAIVSAKLGDEVDVPEELL